ncbi:MAG: hypothetical protein AAF826_13850, partial [Pseudomonadota bacterium]
LLVSVRKTSGSVKMPMEWVMGLVGGLMIGTAAAVYLLLNGRIMGASGILGGLLDGSGAGNALPRAAFLVGLIVFPVVYALFAEINPTRATTNIPLLIIAGLLVGIGTRMGGGCTSGHGVCGMSRLSVRSIVATIIYITAAIVALAFLKAVGGVQ